MDIFTPEFFVGLAIGIFSAKWGATLFIFAMIFGVLVVWANPGNPQVIDWFNVMASNQIGSSMTDECFKVAAGAFLGTLFGSGGNNS
jgi:hypothetical protein